MLTEDPGPQQQTAGLSGLSARKRELVTRSRRAAPTPRSPRPAVHQRPHCVLAPDRIRDKTGCRRRADLTQLALTAGLV
jgi:hypothetical protein